jgi:methionine-gamma-lyase
MHSVSTHFASICVKDPIIEGHASHIPPIYATSTFAYEDLDAAFAFFRGESSRFTYSRLGNPTSAFVAEKIAAMECCGIMDEDGQPLSARGLLFASGMAAISTAILSQIKAGDAILTQSNLYGTTNELMVRELAQMGIKTIYADFSDPALIENLLINDETINLIYLETPANPTLACVDIDAICAVAAAQGVKTIVDNTFATSYVQQPLKWGADIVVYSTTKFMNGHGTGISGAAICRDVADHKSMFRIMKNYGGVCSPFESFLLNNGLKTLPLRMEMHQQNAQQLAEFLVTHHAVSQVNFLGLESHPDHALAKLQMNGPTGMLSFELAGGLEAGMDFQRAIRFCTLTASLGTADTLVTHPASTSHVNVPREQRYENGISDGLIRVSVGLEDIRDILSDFSQALDSLQA